MALSRGPQPREQYLEDTPGGLGDYQIYDDHFRLSVRSENAKEGRKAVQSGKCVHVRPCRLR
jgi:hypothetical protein